MTYTDRAGEMGSGLPGPGVAADISTRARGLVESGMTISAALTEATQRAAELLPSEGTRAMNLAATAADQVVSVEEVAV